MLFDPLRCARALSDCNICFLEGIDKAKFMKKHLLMVLGLASVQVTHADFNRLAVNITPTASTYATDAVIDITADSNGTGMLYRYQLECTAGSGGGAVVAGTLWSSLSTWRIEAGPMGLTPGGYRLTVFARENGNAGDVMSWRSGLRIAGTPDGRCASMAAKNTVQNRFDTAVLVLKKDIAALRKQRKAKADISSAMARYASSTALADWLMSRNWLRAPDGGKAFLPLPQGSELAQYGAIGIEVVTPPASATNWSALVVDVHLPAYAPPGVAPVVAKTVRLTWMQ